MNACDIRSRLQKDTPMARPVLPREQLWSIDTGAMITIRRGVAGVDMNSLTPPPQDEGYAVEDGTALIDISGVMEKSTTLIGWLFGACSMADVREQLAAAVNDPSVQRIVLRIDSPGGTVAGTSDLAEDIRLAAEQKEVIAFIEDQACSAAYWVASQATTVYANKNAMIGNIGTFLIVEDWSAAFEGAGVMTYVIKAGRYKGIGVQGTVLTDDQMEHLQEVTNRQNAYFLGDVKSGRDLSDQQLASVSEAGIYVGRDAIAVGLIDGIRRLDDVLAGASQVGSSMTSRSGKTAAKSQSTHSKGKEQMGKPQGQALTKWNNIVCDLIAEGMSPVKARMQAARDYPKLRQRVINEANAKQSTR